MIKITLIGAGSAGFCFRLVQDILCFDSLQDAHFSLMDIDAERLELTHRALEHMREANALRCRFTASTDLKAALSGADFSLCMIQAGGLEPYQLDIDIPLKYGLDQCVGDTMNPGGVFRGLRHIPALLDILRVAREVCPDVIFMNYANPMAICCWAMQQAFPEIRTVGLCHGVQLTTNKLCAWLGLDPGACRVTTAGINHMAWFLEMRHKGQDVYPFIWQRLDEEGPIKGEHYRFELFKATGYFMTESPGHLSEYLPYFRHREDLKGLFGGEDSHSHTGWYLKLCLQGLERYQREVKAMAEGEKPVPYEAGAKSVEYAADIMNAVVTDRPFRFAGNVLNQGAISNLPDDCCVEVPVFADASGLSAGRVGALPEVCAGLNQTNITVQRLAVQAGLEGDREAAYHACLLDPLTAATLAPHEIRNMVDEMFAAQMAWLPQFRDKTSVFPGVSIGRTATGARKVREGARIVKTSLGLYDKEDQA